MNRWDRENLIVTMADSMIEYGWTLWDLVENYCHPLTTIYFWLTKDLKHIDDERYVMCKHVMDYHKHVKKPRRKRR